MCIPGDGDVHAAILFYGEAPGATEEAEGRPFVGDAGKVVDSRLSAAGLKREDIYISNIIRCRPPGNRTPTKDEVEACRMYTVRELARVDPKVIVALGGSALKALTGVSAIAKSRGKLLPLLPEYRSEVRVVATYHPAAGLHNRARAAEYDKAIEEDFHVARRVAEDDKGSARIVAHDAPEAREVLREFLHLDSLGCDLEWEVFDEGGMWPWSNRGAGFPRIVSVALAGRIDGEPVGISAPVNTKFGRAMIKVIERVPTDYHNAIGDLIWLYSRGIKVKAVSGDTLILASLENLDVSLGLKPLASLMTDMPPGWEQPVKGSSLGTMPRDLEGWRQLLTYNAQDAVAEVLLKEVLLEKLRAELLPLYDHVLLPAIPVMAQAALHGVPINKERLEMAAKKGRRLLVRLIERVGAALKLPGNYEEILRKDAVLGAYIEEATGKMLPKTEKTHKPSVTIKWLEQHQADSPALADLVTIRHLEKLESTYFKPWGKMLAWQGDGRLHTVIRLAQASTGRTSAEADMGATLQQFPRSSKMRGLVTADPGWGIIAADQSQIELRTAADASQDPTMLRLLRAGKDLHIATAGMIKSMGAGKTLDQYLANEAYWMDGVTERERDGAKPFNFGLLYGGRERVVIDTALKDYGIALSWDAASQGYKAFFTLYSLLPAWHEAQWVSVRRGYTESKLHRRRNISALEGEDDLALLRKAINTPNQAFASDLSLYCMVYTQELLVAEELHLSAIIFGFVHDSILIHCDLVIADRVLEIVKEAWEHPPLGRLGISLSVPLVAKVTGPHDSWA